MPPIVGAPEPSQHYVLGCCNVVGNECARSRRRTFSCARCDKYRFTVSVHSPAPPPPPAEAARRLGGERELLLLLLLLAGLMLLLPLHCILGVRRGRGGGGMGCTRGAWSELSLLLLMGLLMVCILGVPLGLRRVAWRGAGSSASVPVQGLTNIASR